MNKNKIVIGICLSLLAIILIAAVSLVLLNKNVEQPEKKGESKSKRIVLVGDTITKYHVGDEYIPPRVILKNEDDSEENISDSNCLRFSNYDLTKPGSYNVDVVYEPEGFQVSTQYKIRVLSNTALDFSVELKNKYMVWGEKINRDNIAVTAVFDDNHQEVVSDYQLLYNPKPDEYGPIMVNIQYQEIKKTFEIEVIGNTLDSKYKSIEEEAVLVLKGLEVDNPSCPKDYELSVSPYGKGRILSYGVFSDTVDSDEKMITFVLNALPDGYEQEGTSEKSNDIIVPSTKTVMVSSEKRIKISIYTNRSLGKSQYCLLFEEMDTTND